jgi:hypothetical protein
MAAVDLVAPNTKILGSWGISNPSTDSVGPAAGKAWAVEAIWAKATGTVNAVILLERKRTSATAYQVEVGYTTLVLGAPAVDLLGMKNGFLDNFYGDTYEIDTVSGTWDVVIEYVEYT